MKRTLTVMSLVLLVAGAAFAGVGEDRLFVQPNATFSGTTQTLLNPSGAAYATGLTTGPSTTNNDDSCDISVMPAASLLLPYFEVNIGTTSSDARNTIFTITNVTEQPQIAHVTIWTDWSYPVIDFSLWLTGYDVVPVSLYDILRNGTIPPTGYDISNIGAYSSDTWTPDFNDDGTENDPGFSASTDGIGYLANTYTGNPNHAYAAITDRQTGCASLPSANGVTIPSSLLTRVQTALTTGAYGSSCAAGSNHGAGIAIGYITIDVANRCSQLLPTDPEFFYRDILWDNSLIGEYMLINAAADGGNFAGGNPMVHIRAIPEGGPFENPHLGTPAFGASHEAVANAIGTNFPFTFYDRYTRDSATFTSLNNQEADRRQPLPSRFAARFIQDEVTGPTGFATDIIIWREGYDVGAKACGSAGGGDLTPAAMVRFDEQENPNVTEECRISPCETEDFETTLYETQARSSAGGGFPDDNADTDDLGGWLYLDLNGDAPRASGDAQAWVSIQMEAENRYSVLYDAAALENGCTPPPADSSSEDAIRPGPNYTPGPDDE
ncbi:MAG: hypothetical protein ABR517_10675 [Thermoanaerobaculia bacterium]